MITKLSGHAKSALQINAMEQVQGAVAMMDYRANARLIQEKREIAERSD
jgi:hypothetical protein